MDEFKDLQELWSAERCEEGPIMIKKTDTHKMVADCVDANNANLIAAAPEIYEALKSLEERVLTIAKELQGTEYEYVFDSITGMVLGDAYYALRKAEGRE